MIALFLLEHLALHLFDLRLGKVRFLLHFQKRFAEFRQIERFVYDKDIFPFDRIGFEAHRSRHDQNQRQVE
ncbi:hypothetical protein D1872_335870 [compost metagenome]